MFLLLSKSSILRSASVALCAFAGAFPFLSEAQAAPDGTLGSALLAAQVQSDGTLLKSAGATGVVKISTGIYEVDFNRDVTNCFYNAVSFNSTVATTVQPRSGNPNGVFIVFRTLGTTSVDPVAADSQFYMTVFCVR